MHDPNMAQIGLLKILLFYLLILPDFFQNNVVKSTWQRGGGGKQRVHSGSEGSHDECVTASTKRVKRKPIYPQRKLSHSFPETNISRENGWLEYYFPIGEASFQGQTVSFREGILLPGRALFETCGTPNIQTFLME